MGHDAAAALFLNSVAPLLDAQDLGAATRRIRNHWPPDHLVEYLFANSSEVVGTAAACLGLVGTMAHCEPLTPLLGHCDARVSEAAENSLWRIWMRAGSDAGNRRLASAIACIESDDYDHADRKLAELTLREPNFAEAHHQRGITSWYLDHLESAAASFHRAVKLNPYHFAAAASLGHVHVQRSDVCGALRHYRHALQIHPRLIEIREAVEAIEAAIGRRRPAAG